MSIEVQKIIIWKGDITMRRKVMICGVVASTLLGAGGATNIYADTSLEEKNQIVSYNTSGLQGTIEDIDVKVDKMIDSIPYDLGFFKWQRTTLMYEEDLAVSGVNIKESNVTRVFPLFLGSNIFTNDTQLEQAYNTSTFSQAITHTTATSTQHGFKSATAVKGKVGIPFIAEGEVSQTLEYNLSNTNTNTKSETNTITAPAQTVKVPPRKTYKTEVYFEKKSTSGNVELLVDYLTGLKAGRIITSIGSKVGQAKNSNGLIQSPIDSNRVRATGKGNFSIEYGTNLIVKTYDITSGQRSAMLVDTKIVPVKNIMK